MLSMLFFQAYSVSRMELQASKVNTNCTYFRNSYWKSVPLFFNSNFWIMSHSSRYMISMILTHKIDPVWRRPIFQWLSTLNNSFQLKFDDISVNDKHIQNLYNQRIRKYQEFWQLAQYSWKRKPFFPLLLFGFL